MQQPLLNSDGSAIYQVEQTKVLCSVNGPLEAKARDELPTQATLEVVVRPNIGLAAIRETLMQDQVHSCLESIVLRSVIPRSLVQIVVQVLETSNDVNDLAAAINVSTVALANAGVPLGGLVVAVSSAFVDGQLVSPAPDSATGKSTSAHVVAFKFDGEGDARIVQVKSTGNFTNSEFLEVLEVSQDNATQVYSDMRETLEQTFKEGTKWA